MKRKGFLQPSRDAGRVTRHHEKPKSTIRSHVLADSAIDDNRILKSMLVGGPARSSQDLNVDWSSFENHVFYDSAASKVNAAFLRVINDFPFDGSEKDVRTFLEDLSGYEKYIYDLFPKSVGYVNFGGSRAIKVEDSTGAEFPDQNKAQLGEQVIAPEGGPITFQMYINAATSSNGNQVITQYAFDESTGFTLFLSQSAATDSAKIVFTVCSGTMSASADVNVPKGQFFHLAAAYLPNNATSSISIFKDGLLAASSSDAVVFGSEFYAKSLTIASGSSFYSNGVRFLPAQTLNAAIDDFRIYHSERAESQRLSDIVDSTWADSDNSPEGLVLHYKFNEPPGDHEESDVVLDSSGNGLHTRITSYDSSCRLTGSSPMRLEDPKLNPVLFPDFSVTSALNSEMIQEGTLYDHENPNYIIRLIPQHYFDDAQIAYSLPTQQGDLNNSYQGTGIPGTGEMGSVQIMTAMLLMYAKVFDEIKIFHDHFSRLTYANYDKNESVSDHFLTFVADYYGIDLPNLFDTTTIDQYAYGRKLSTNIAAEQPLRQVQNEIFRRVLTNIREIFSSKGTHAGIRAVFNAAGIAPNSFFKIREHGGPIAVSLDEVRESVREVAASLDMSGSLASVTPQAIGDGFASNIPFVTSSYLSGSRLERGYPEPVGVIAGGRPSTNPNDGLLTSGSWTIEASYKYDPEGRHTRESLLRLHVTGSSSTSVIANIVAVSGSTSVVSAYLHTDYASLRRPLALHITGANVFDGNRWHISLGRMRNDDPGMPVNSVSSSYSLRCARVTEGGSAVFHTASAFYSESSTPQNDALQYLNALSNSSGAFVVVGSQSLAPTSPFLNSAVIGDEARATDFSGHLSHLRFWSKYLTDTETNEHARNPRSLGVDNPIVNFGFSTTTTGSFQSLRMDVSFDQQVTSSDGTGNIRFVDFSQQERGASGFGFEPLQTVIKPDVRSFSQLSTRFDVRQTDEKVRVRSFSEQENLAAFPDALPAPLFEQVRSETPTSDNRLSIEASAVDALNDDMIKVLASLDFFENALGDPRVLNEEHYPDLEALRRVYFNRLVAKPELRAMYDVFKWVSEALGDLIHQLVPINSVFLGISYVVESHIGERAKVKYYFDNQYRDLSYRASIESKTNDFGASTSKSGAKQADSLTTTRSSKG
jgi:hypothetical protein